MMNETEDSIKNQKDCFFVLGEEGEEADDDCKYVCVPQVSFLEQNLCMSLSIKREEETERVV